MRSSTHADVCFRPNAPTPRTCSCISSSACDFVSTRYCVFRFAVDTLLRNWLRLSKTSQDARVAHCPFNILEDYLQKLYNASSRDYRRRSFCST